MGTWVPVCTRRSWDVSLGPSHAVQHLRGLHYHSVLEAGPTPPSSMHLSPPLSGQHFLCILSVCCPKRAIEAVLPSGQDHEGWSWITGSPQPSMASLKILVSVRSQGVCLPLTLGLGLLSSLSHLSFSPLLYHSAVNTPPMTRNI